MNNFMYLEPNPPSKNFHSFQIVSLHILIKSISRRLFITSVLGNGFFRQIITYLSERFPNQPSYLVCVSLKWKVTFSTKIDGLVFSECMSGRAWDDWGLGNVGKWIKSHWEMQKKMQLLIGFITNNLHLLIRVLRYHSEYVTELAWEVGLKRWNLYPADNHFKHKRQW